MASDAPQVAMQYVSCSSSMHPYRTAGGAVIASSCTISHACRLCSAIEKCALPLWRRVMGRLAPLTSTTLTRGNIIPLKQRPMQHQPLQLRNASHAVASSRFSRLTARQDAAISGRASPFAIDAAGAKATKASGVAGMQSPAAAAGASTAFQVITSPLTVTLADGTYTFALYAIDAVGNAGRTSEYRVVVGSGDFAPRPPSPPPPPVPPPPGTARQAGAPRHRPPGAWAAVTAIAAGAAALVLASL